MGQHELTPLPSPRRFVRVRVRGRTLRCGIDEVAAPGGPGTPCALCGGRPGAPCGTCLGWGLVARVAWQRWRCFSRVVGDDVQAALGRPWPSFADVERRRPDTGVDLVSCWSGPALSAAPPAVVESLGPAHLRFLATVARAGDRVYDVTVQVVDESARRPTPWRWAPVIVGGAAFAAGVADAIFDR